MKIVPKYHNKILSIPGEIVAERLTEASKDELKVLLAVFSEQEFDVSELASRLDMTVNAFNRALNVWLETGIMEADAPVAVSKKTPAKNAAEKKPAVKKSSSVRTVTVHTSLPHYTTEELADAVENRIGTAELLDSCQQILGKMFNANETATIIGLMDHLSLSSEYILLLCSHASSVHKKSVRYIEKTAIDLYDRDVMTYSELETELSLIERRISTEAFVKNLFGVGKRALIKKEKEFIKAWAEKYAFSHDMIEEAYEITVNNTGEASMNYANAILENWYAAGFQTVDEVRAAEAERKGKQEKLSGTSFDTDEFFDAALKRSYGGSQN